MLRYKKIFINKQCNNHCLHCSYQKKDFPQPTFESIISKITPEDQDGVEFYGGEPTLRDDLLPIIQTAKSNGFRRIKLDTNGRVFSNTHFLQSIIESGCNVFEIKLWGSNPKLHDSLTQTYGSFIETLKGLDNLVGFSEEKFICIRIPICKQNYLDLENTVAMVLGFEINRIVLSFTDYSLSIKEAMFHIRNAINISIFNRVWILTEGLPFCIMKGLEPHIIEIYTGWNNIENRVFQKHKNCEECIFNELCPGIEKDYLNRFGEDEFLPIKENKYFSDIKMVYE